MKLLVRLGLILNLFVSVAPASSQEASTYVVKGAICVDGSWFNPDDSIAVGIEFRATPAELRTLVEVSQEEVFFLRGDERNLIIKFKSGEDFEYRSQRAPCRNSGWSLISLEKID